MSEELKSCPFCDRPSARIIEGPAYDFVQCFVCGAKGPIRYRKEHAITAWNTRAGEKA
ncbi:Lar family restriction alleviation protein [Acetobacter okinawensis]|uniref:Lar family restriction alleviation protein n=1 Tax=Acetobacter okinawensis TaxID=1076594 RepID=UPI0039EA240E